MRHLYENGNLHTAYFFGSLTKKWASVGVIGILAQLFPGDWSLFVAGTGLQAASVLRRLPGSTFQGSSIGSQQYRCFF